MIAYFFLFCFIFIVKGQDEEVSDIIKSKIRVGGLFEEENSPEEAAFKHAIERVNLDSNILPEATLVAHIQQIDPGNSFEASNIVCGMLEEGIAGMFGPQSPPAASHVQSIADAFDIPHMETRWDPRIRKEVYHINFTPHPDTMSRAFADLVTAFGWDKYALIYDEYDSLFKLQGIITTSVPHDRIAILKQLPPDTDDYRPLLKEVMHDADIFKIVIDCELSKIESILKQAQQVGMLNFQYSYIITTLDLHTLDLEDFKFADLNITAFRLVDPEKPEVAKVIEEWNSLIGNEIEKPPLPLPEVGSAVEVVGTEEPPKEVEEEEEEEEGGEKNEENIDGEENEENYQDFDYFSDSYSSSVSFKSKKPSKRPSKKQHKKPHFNSIKQRKKRQENSPPLKMMTTDIALLYDAVSIFGKALHYLQSSRNVEIKPLSCSDFETWDHGYSLINHMKLVQHQGLTGSIQFDTSGYRKDITMDVIQLKPQGIIKIGVWDTKFAKKFNWTLPPPVYEDPDPENSSLKNKTIVATTIINPPFCMLTRSQEALTGNARYEGYSIELLHHLSIKLGFKYIVKLVDDNSYGSLNKETGTWNGMMKEVLDGTADMAVADLTISKDRQKAVGFTMPFMNLGISILFTSPKAKPPSLFSFMAPFSIEVWMGMCISLVGVSLALFITARITPYEWIPSHPCVDEPEELENEFTLINCFWFTFGCIVGGGADIAPKCVSTRIVATIWWFFTLIMVSSYTANLATFLIVQDLEVVIKSLDDLPKQEKVQYGCVATGSTAAFFRDSPFMFKRDLWKRMTLMKPSPFMSGNKAAVERVKDSDGTYAFFMESTVIEYNMERICGLTQVGDHLDSKGYGIALKKESKYRQALSSGILSLQEAGILDQLKRKWWKEERKEAADCGGDGEGDVKPLLVANVAGCFVILVGGCLFAILWTMVDFFYSARQVSREEGSSFWDEIKSELAFVCKCTGDTKPVRKGPSINGSITEEEINKEATYYDKNVSSSHLQVPTLSHYSKHPNDHCCEKKEHFV